jgi:RNA polymerase sigma-70 factor (ECF subfamily)
MTLTRSLFARERVASGGAEQAQRVERIVGAHADAVWRTARRLGVPVRDLEDVAQEVMLVVFRRIGDIEHARERAFVLGTTARVCSNWRRTLRRHPEDPSDIVDEVAGASLHAALASDGERRLEQSERLIILDRALREMNEQQRESFVMFELEQMTAIEIARELEVTEATVVSRVRRARDVFWRTCRSHGLVVPPRSRQT